MATHSNILAWRIPGTEEPSRLPSMGSHRVGHDISQQAVKEYTKQLDTVKHVVKNSTHKWRTIQMQGC